MAHSLERQVLEYALDEILREDVDRHLGSEAERGDRVVPPASRSRELRAPCTMLALAAGVLCDTADSWTAAEKPTDPAKELERV